MKVTRKLGWELSARGRDIKQSTVHTSQDGNVVLRLDEPCYVEPQWGYPFTEHGVLLEEPLVPSWSKSYRPWHFAVPSRREVSKRRKVIELDEAVLFRDLYEWNYFHFHFDVLAKMQPLMESGINIAVPKLLGAYAAELKFPGDVLTTGKWDVAGWTVPDPDTYFRVNKLYYVSLASPFEERAEFLREMIPAQGCGKHYGNKVYINRNSAGGRRIRNHSEVELVMHEFGISSVDTASIPFSEQVAIVSSADLIVAIHGAGMTNLIYSLVAPLQVVELYASNYNSWAFRDIIQAMGGTWIGLPGEPAPGRPQAADFTVDVAQLRKTLARLFDEVA